MDTLWDPVETEMHGVRVPKPIGDKLILGVIYESDGFAVAVSHEAAATARREVAATEGLHLCPEGSAVLRCIPAGLELGPCWP